MDQAHLYDALRSFRCCRDEDIEHFLQEKAVEFFAQKLVLGVFYWSMSRRSMLGVLKLMLILRFLTKR